MTNNIKLAAGAAVVVTIAGVTTYKTIRKNAIARREERAQREAFGNACFDLAAALKAQLAIEKRLAAGDFDDIATAKAAFLQQIEFEKIAIRFDK